MKGKMESGWIETKDGLFSPAQVAAGAVEGRRDARDVRVRVYRPKAVSRAL